LITILLIGKTGQVGFELARALNPVSRLVAPSRMHLDLSDPDSIRRIILESKPDVIVNATGFTIVDNAESQPALAMHINATAPGIIAELAAKTGALMVHYSTTFVFDGTKLEPYTEDDTPHPINTYGRTKLAGEQAIMAACKDHLILRASWVYSARRKNFALAILKLAREQSELQVVTDQIGSPTWARDYADLTVQLLLNPAQLRDAPGIYHLSAQSHCSRMHWAHKLIESAKTAWGNSVGWATLLPTTTTQYPLPAARPLYTVASTRKIEKTFGISVPVWEDRIDAFMRTLPLR
jgi:dTDP-4-dehydrorhamnose reductase